MWNIKLLEETWVSLVAFESADLAIVFGDSQLIFCKREKPIERVRGNKKTEIDRLPIKSWKQVRAS